MRDKKVLFIAPRFFGYEIEIQKEMERRGARVNFLADRPYEKPWQKALTRLAPKLIQPYVNRYYRTKLTEFSATNYDIIFVINGQTLASEILDELKVSFPNAYKVLYMWDSMDNRPGVANVLNYYDKALTFDPKSASDFGMLFRPLFFTKGFERPSKNEFRYQLSFIGTMHSDRYEVMSKLRGQLENDIGAYWYLYLQANWVYWLYRLLKPAMRHANKKEFQFTPLDKAKLHEIFATSQVILDIEHPHQLGLTMRTFETIGACKKLITTNSNIRAYDFFCKDNICIIERNNPNVPLSFWTSPYQSLPYDMYYKYSLAGWMDEVLG